jgi:hypothetical protein
MLPVNTLTMSLRNKVIQYDHVPSQHGASQRQLFEGEVWCGTIMPGNPTTKIIRNRLPRQ